MTMTVCAAIYARSSPDCPVAAEQQVELLRTVAAERGWVVTGVFTDNPMPLKRGRERRPAETALRDAIRQRGLQKVLVSSIDRIGRTLEELVRFLEMCQGAGVSLWLDDQMLDTAQSNGLSIFNTADMMAHHLRQSRRARILQGQASARNLRVRFGRPPIPITKVEKAKTFLATGKSLREVARLAGISSSAVGRLKNAMGSAAV
jgi:DNA invertase Pin-like site-specific DNA recombinase